MTENNNGFGNERIESLADNLGRAFDSKEPEEILQAIQPFIASETTQQ